MELAGNDERGRRARRVRFLEKLCFQLDDSRKAAEKDLERFREEFRLATIRADEEIKAVSRRVTAQAQLSDARFRSVENYAGVGGLPVESAHVDGRGMSRGARRR